MMFTDASMPFLHPMKNPIVFLTHTKERAGEWALNWHRVTPEHIDHMAMVESLLAVTSQCPLGLITMAVMMASCANWLKHCWYLSHWDMKGISEIEENAWEFKARHTKGLAWVHVAAWAQPVLGYDNSSPSTLVSYYDGPCSPMNDPQQTAPILQCYTNQPDRITVIDLRDLDKGMEALHLSSLPPTLVKLFEDISRDSRHKSLPHMIQDIWPKTPSSLEESDKEKGDTGSSLGNASDGASSQLVPATKDTEGSLCSSHVSWAWWRIAGFWHISREKWFLARQLS